MPVVADEAVEYGYVGENRHMVQSFLDGVRPEENFCRRRSTSPSSSWPPT